MRFVSEEEAIRRGLLLGLGIGIGNGIVASAWADQCVYLTEAWARDAASHVHVGDRVTRFCEPCDDKAPEKPESVASVEVRALEDWRTEDILSGTPKSNWSKELHWELAFDGHTEGIDLAYVFVESQDVPGRFDNLAKLAGCPAEGVSASIRLR